MTINKKCCLYTEYAVLQWIQNDMLWYFILKIIQMYDTSSLLGSFWQIIIFSRHLYFLKCQSDATKYVVLLWWSKTVIMVKMVKIFHKTEGPMIFMASHFVYCFVSLKSHDVTLVTNISFSSSPNCSSTFLNRFTLRKTTLFFPPSPLFKCTFLTYHTYNEK